MKRFLTAIPVIVMLGLIAVTPVMAFDFNNPPPKPKNTYTGGSVMMPPAPQTPPQPYQYGSKPRAQSKQVSTWVNKVADSPERAACLQKCREQMEKSNALCQKAPDPPSILACQQASENAFNNCQGKCPAK